MIGQAGGQTGTKFSEYPVGQNMNISWLNHNYASSMYKLKLVNDNNLNRKGYKTKEPFVKTKGNRKKA